MASKVKPLDLPDERDTGPSPPTAISDQEDDGSSDSIPLNTERKRGKWWKLLLKARNHQKSEIQKASEDWFSKDKQRLLDKLTFTFAVVGTVLFAVCVASPIGRGYLPIVFCISYPTLIAIRFVQYASRKWHYFLLDFCYWANLSLMVYILFCPESATTFAVIFAVSHAPLPFTVILYRNSLVFHSIDRCTSFYIHMVPLAVTYALRWFPQDCSRVIAPGIPDYFKTDETFFYQELEETFGLQGTDATAAFFLPISVVVVFFMQQNFEIFLTHWVSAQPCCKNIFRVYHDESYLTLFRYSSTSGSGLVFKLLNYFGEEHQLKMWILLNNLFTVLTSLPVFLWYKIQLCNMAFGVLVFCWGTWNGANFYMEVFSKHYSAKKSTFKEEIRISRSEYDSLLAKANELQGLLEAQGHNSQKDT